MVQLGFAVVPAAAAAAFPSARPGADPAAELKTIHPTR
jgi:hypothetical protein